MSVPRVSIGLPVYNGENYLRFAVDSILDQDYRDFELIICDNASTDETFSICQQYAASDERVRYVRNETNIGAAANYNRAFEFARSEFFKWAAHDDMHLPGFLRRCAEVLRDAPPSVVLVAPRTEIIDENGARIHQDWHIESLDIRQPHPHQRVADVVRKVDWATAQFGLFRTDALRKTRLMDRFVASDYVLLMELAILGEIWEIPEVLFQRRFHAGISTNANKTQAEFLQWFDPSQRPKNLLSSRMRPALQPRMRLGLEYARSILRMPLSPTEKLWCLCSASFIWFCRESRRLEREYMSLFLHNLKKPFSAPARRWAKAWFRH